MIALAVLSAFALLLIFAGVRDVTSFTIPNWIPVSVVAFFLPAALAAGLSASEIGVHLAAGAGLLVVGMGMFALRWMGGGDVKLLAAIAVWMGWPDVLVYLAAVAMLGGMFTILVIRARRRFGPVAEGMGISLAILERTEAIPYGVAIAGAALLYLPRSELGGALISIVA